MSAKKTIMGKLKIVYGMEDLDKIEKNDLVYLKAKGDLLVFVVRGFDKGAGAFLANCGRTNHGVIAAKELGIPFCLVKEENNFTEGQVYTILNNEVSKVDLKPQDNHQLYGNIFINLGFPKRVMQNNPGLAQVSDGVGFARLEFAILEITEGRHPINYMAEHGHTLLEEQIYEHFKLAVEMFANKRFWIRTDDFSSNQLFDLKEGRKYEKVTSDEIVGFRGIARSINNVWLDMGNFEPSLKGVSWIEPQFKAISKLARDFPNTKIGVFAPMVRSVLEYKKWLKIAKDTIKEDIDYGVMVEIPSITGEGIKPFLQDKLINFVVFGSNDLTALTLGIDRTDARLQHLFSEEEPSVLNSMVKTIEICRNEGVMTMIGGEAACRESLMEKLHGARISGFSVTPNLETVFNCRKFISHLTDNGK